MLDESCELLILDRIYLFLFPSEYCYYSSLKIVTCNPGIGLLHLYQLLTQSNLPTMKNQDKIVKSVSLWRATIGLKLYLKIHKI